MEYNVNLLRRTDSIEGVDEVSSRRGVMLRTLGSHKRLKNEGDCTVSLQVLPLRSQTS